MHIVEWKKKKKKKKRKENSFTLLMSKTEICTYTDQYKVFTVRLLTKKI